MVDRITKILRTLSTKDRKRLVSAVTRILEDDFLGLDIKKLSGREDIYRVRIGDFRIIFRKLAGNENAIIAIERRSEKTYI